MDLKGVEIKGNIAPLAVQESGGALKVHTDGPHLVSLGGGRLSTAITLHPIPPGRIILGSGNHVDIQVHGTGVEKNHCHIDNINGVVTLYPLAQAITIDGDSVGSPTRLTQGVILTIGRSNHLRFNHPAEAQLMKSILPNPRISMGPIQFYPKTNKPPVPPKKSPSTSWTSDDDLQPEEHTILSKVSKFELFASQNLKKNVSPKVFPSDLVTVNTPARDVLGKNPVKNLNYYEKVNKVPKINVMSQSMTMFTKKKNVELKRHGSDGNLVDEEMRNNENGKLQSPSPYFNRNPPLYRNNITQTAVVTPYRNVELGKINNQSIEDLSQRNSDAELKRNKAQEERLREQETEKAEQARLEEILNMCAEYEKQAQCERVNTKTVVTPNRIKTNGSLPRDKRSPNSPSSFFTSEEPIFKFDFDTTNVHQHQLNQQQSKQNWCARNNLNSYENVSINKFPQNNKFDVMDGSAGNNSGSESRHHYENVVPYYHPQSPRTRIKTYVTCNKNEMNGSFKSENKSYKEEFENLEQFVKQMDSPKTPINFLPSPPKTSTPNNITKKLTDPFLNENLLHEMQANQNNQIPQNHQTNEDHQKKIKIEELTNERNQIQNLISITKRKISEIEIQEEELLRELELEKSLIFGEYKSELTVLKELEQGKLKLQEQAIKMEEKMEKSRKEQEEEQIKTKQRLDEAVANLNRLQNMDDIGELTKAQDLLENERKFFEDLEFHHLEEEANLLATREELQREIQDLSLKIDERKSQLLDLENQKSEAFDHTTEESKSLERTLITHLRNLESHRQRLKNIDIELESLTGQKLDYYSDNEISDDSDSKIDSQKIYNQLLSESMCKLPSQDDIDRISKVTTDAPMDLGENTGSLGRKTIESFKEIERNRQLHLVKEGSHVIEEERKRVLELKRRVQDEVRAQWEERRQRECNSLNSVGSEDSKGCSSEGGVIRESVAESEDADDNKIKHSVTFESSSNLLNETPQRRNSHQEYVDSADSDRRPLSESSDLSYDSQLTVKPRPRRSLSSPQQRPLTRYLPIRNDSLNLRQHIESAGHQVELCPHVALDSTTCRGYLSKMGSRFHSWNKRWFVFDRIKRTFVYYPDRGEKKHRGGAYFQAIEEVYLDHLNTVKSPYPHLTFIVKTHERAYHLMAPSPEAMRIWIDVIFTGAEGYQEFEHGT